jgi:hypothetical protein
LPTFKIESLDWILHQAQHILLDGILVGAEHGDLICGYDFTFDTIKYLGLDYLKFPATTTNIVKFLKIKGMDEKPAHAWADLFKATFEKSPRPIVDMADFAWWAGFNFRWQHAREKLQIRLIEGTDYQTFFGSRDFQVWSSNNKFVINSVNDIKRSFREEIYRFTNDTNYSNNKIKYPSVSFMYGTKNKYNALTYNRQLIRVSDPMMYYNPNNFFSTWLKTQERKDI